MASKKEYKKLPGRGMHRDGNRFFAYTRKYCTLWLGADHLLVVLSSAYEQEFKRFYFSDIQAFTLRKTKSWFQWNLVITAVSVVFLALAIAVPEFALRITFVSIAGFFLLCLLINYLFGPTCVTHLKTAVQIEELSSLKRLRTARKVLLRLQPMLLQAQSDLIPSPPSLGGETTLVP